MNQTQLQHKLNKFTRNGKDAEAQEILARIGYAIAALDACYERLLTWRHLRKEAKRLMGVQKKATAIERRARAVASRLSRKFRKTVRVLFKDDEPVLTRLGLYPSIWSSNGKQPANGSAPADSDADPVEPEQTNGSSQSRRNPSMSTAAVIDRWRMTLEAALDLEEEHLARLAERGWGIDEITEALQAVEAYADSDLDQPQKVTAQRETAASARALKEELKQWYTEARSLTLLAIDDLPPDQAARLKELLGL
jgi:hypothetical protein